MGQASRFPERQNVRRINIHGDGSRDEFDGYYQSALTFASHQNSFESGERPPSDSHALSYDQVWMWLRATTPLKSMAQSFDLLLI
ncbi:MAG TPA: hypothetical protein VGR72_02375 [Candidatus Acidoferrales bacterium]|nr:hypothetical protein [Candidatus Acidoferrales bacterium]